MTDLELRSALHQRFAAAPPMPDVALREVLEHIPETPQQRLAMPLPTATERFRTMFNATTTVVAGLAIAIGGGALLIGTQQGPAPIGPHAAVGASPSAAAEMTQPIATDDSPADADPAREGLPSGSVGPGPWIAWERAPEFDGAFEPQPPDGYRLRSDGGGASRSDKNKVADGYQPLRLGITRPDGSVESHTIDRNYRVSSWAALDDRILVVTKPGMPLWRLMDNAVNQFVKGGRRNEDCCDIQPNGTITTDGSGGLPRTIPFSRWRDELETIGFDRGDLAQPRHHWLWREGAGWAEVAQSPGRVRQIVGTPTGFYLVDVNGGVHHSSDGEIWQTFREGDDLAQKLATAGNAVVILDDQGASLADPGGERRLPFSDPLMTEDQPFPGFGKDPHYGADCAEYLRPSIGTVVHDFCHNVLVLSPDEGGWGLVEEQVDRMWVTESGDLIATLSGGNGQAFRAVPTDGSSSVD